MVIIYMCYYFINSLLLRSFFISSLRNAWCLIFFFRY